MLIDIINKLRGLKWLNIFIIYTRYLIGGAYALACMPKIMGLRFTQPNLEGQVFDFFEALYATGLYWNFLGWSQLLAAALLMTQRWSTLGAVIFFPISLNIFFITISMDFAATPIITGLMLLANLMLLFWDYPKLSVLLNTPTKFVLPSFVTHPITQHKIWEWLGVTLLLFTVAAYHVQLNPFFWFMGCISTGLFGLLFYLCQQRFYYKNQTEVFAENSV